VIAGVFPKISMNGLMYESDWTCEDNWVSMCRTPETQGGSVDLWPLARDKGQF